MNATSAVNETYTNLVSHFGKALANRIYACAMIVQEEKEFVDEEGNADMATATRYTIGCVKRMLRQATRKLSWVDAVERLETEQVEARHYGMSTAFSRDIARIERINADGYEAVKADGATVHVATGKEAKAERKAVAVSKVMLTLEAESHRYDESAQAQAEVKQWVAEYLATASRTKLTFLYRVVAEFRAGQDVSEEDRKNISRRYVPRGVKPMEFVELFARYA